MKKGLMLFGLAGLMALAVGLSSPAMAKPNKGGGGGGTGGGSCCSGGLPALWSRVIADEATIALLQSQVDTLNAEVATLDDEVATLQSDVAALKLDVKALKRRENFAVVASDGTLNRSYSSAGAVASEHVATGQYEVSFARDVTKCAYTATLGDVANAAPVPGFVSVTGDFDNDATGDVFVYTFNTTGAAADASFHLNVTCGN